MKGEYYVIGLMSGTSMDGLDIAFCRFMLKNGNWGYSILNSETIKYSKDWLEKLNSARSLSNTELEVLDSLYGKYLGEQVLSFTKRHQILDYDFISSHGHTIHHRPEEGVTIQIGSGMMISETTSKKVVNDFRTQDVTLGGQGAPLVPIGDRLLFSEYQACLNLGGFANISFDLNKRVAFDICPANIVLNYVTRKMGLEYDQGGEIARLGHVDPKLLGLLNTLPFYKKEVPKSLGIEWVERNVYPLLSDEYSNEDLLATLAEHISIQIGKVFNYYGIKTVLVSGGGVFNQFLMGKIKTKTSSDVVVLDDLISEFKEALVFAFLGVLKVRNEINVLSSVTGAKKNHSAGTVFTPKRK